MRITNPTGTIPVTPIEADAAAEMEKKDRIIREQLAQLKRLAARCVSLELRLKEAGLVIPPSIPEEKE